MADAQGVSKDSDIWGMGLASRARTEREHVALTDLWLHGVSLLGANVSSVDRWSADVERDHVLVAVLAHAVNTQLAGYLLATSGYCTQAQALIRICEEDWLAFLYVLNFPAEAKRFLDFGPGTADTPRWIDMVQALESKLQVQMTPTRETIKWLHRLAHVDRLSIRGSYNVLPTEQPATTRAHFRMGPHYDGDDFVNCAGQFVVQLHHLIQESEGLCLAIGVTPTHPNAFEEYGALLTPWLKQLEQEDEHGQRQDEEPSP
jgi:hypothetical protein